MITNHFFQFVVSNLEGDTDYEFAVSAGTKSLSNTSLFHYGNISNRATIYLPMESCNDTRSTDQESKTFVVVGSVCATVLVVLFVLGFVVRR